MTDNKDAGEKAKELLVYGPIGLAMYLRDTAPSFLRLFVARGRSELDQRKRSVGDQLGEARKMGESVSAVGGLQAKTILAEGLAKVRARAGETLEALGGLMPTGADGEDPAPAPDAPTDVEATTEVPGPTAASAAATATAVKTKAPKPAKPVKAAKPAKAPKPRAAPRVGDDESLAIPDYDELSASQVVDRLAGLGVAALDAIRSYELGHRARTTVLGKIDQLTRR